MPDSAPENGNRDDISRITPGRSGRPSFSLEALRERVERQFQDETANRTDILLDLDSDDKRRNLLSEVLDYVLAVETVTLSPHDRAVLFEKAYRNLFSFGPLDEFLRDETITEITVNGSSDIHVRHGFDRLEAVRAAFDDNQHLQGLLERMLASAGVILSSAGPFIETGVIMAGRPARLTVAAPPVSPVYSLHIRLHPRQPILDPIPAQAADLLRAILAANYGLLIVGDVSLGKTTLAGALAHTLPADFMIIAVERAAEMHLPAHIERRTPVPPTPDDPGSDFAAEFQAALDAAPDWLIVDEIRIDESAAVWDALTRSNGPFYLWVFRGSSEPKRLKSALGMVIRKQHQALPQEDIDRALADHLPFVAAFRLSDGLPRLHLIAEWVLVEGGLSLRPILSEQGGVLAPDQPPTRPL